MACSIQSWRLIVKHSIGMFMSDSLTFPWSLSVEKKSNRFDRISWILLPFGRLSRNLLLTNLNILCMDCCTKCQQQVQNLQKEYPRLQMKVQRLRSKCTWHIVQTIFSCNLWSFWFASWAHDYTLSLTQSERYWHVCGLMGVHFFGYHLGSAYDICK